MKKRKIPVLDATITTVGDMLHALSDQKPNEQIYCHIPEYTDAFLEITEMVKVLPKENDASGGYIILRVK